MSAYSPQWITEQLAVGPAPLSYNDLAVIRNAGIVAIVNLCSEIEELSIIERNDGFEVFFLPIEDDSIPEADELDKALEWLDEALYLNKKVLVHCRYGMGRTGTFVTSYLIRRGFGLKLAEKTLKKIRSVPTSYAQWRLLRKYNRLRPELKVRRKPDLRSRQTMSLSPFFADYERIIADLNERLGRSDRNICGRDNENCCHELFDVTLIEAAYLQHIIGSTLDQASRKGIAERLKTGSQRYTCALSLSGVCILFSSRPIRCRLAGIGEEDHVVAGQLFELSSHLFRCLTDTIPEHETRTYSISRVLSGAFVQDYFAEAMRVKQRETQ